MKYIMSIWVVLLVSAALWVVATRPPDWLNAPWKPVESDVEAAPVDEGAVATAKDSDEILRNSTLRIVRSRKAVEAQVLEVLSGDTIRVALDGERFIVGYLGIETPEVGHDVLGTEPFGQEAFDRNRELVQGQTVYLESDIFTTDKEGRQLRYVYVDDLMMNALLVHEGLARTTGIARGTKYAEVIYDLQSRAIVERKGGWMEDWPNTVFTR